jgi:hypothetical protein
LLQQQRDDNLPDTAEVFDIPTTKGPGGTTVMGEPVKVAASRVRFLPTESVEEAIRADAEKKGARYVLVFPVSTRVLHGNRVVVKGENAAWQRTVEVVGLAAPGDFPTARVAFGREIPS